jgi:hypothetical protein
MAFPWPQACSIRSRSVPNWRPCMSGSSALVAVNADAQAHPLTGIRRTNDSRRDGRYASDCPGCGLSASAGVLALLWLICTGAQFMQPPAPVQALRR